MKGEAVDRMEWTDSAMLQALDLAKRQGLSMGALGRHFGVTRSAVAGVLNRVRDNLER